MQKSRKKMIVKKPEKQTLSVKKKGIWVSDCPPMTKADAKVLVQSLNNPGELPSYVLDR